MATTAITQAPAVSTRRARRARPAPPATTTPATIGRPTRHTGTKSKKLLVLTDDAIRMAEALAKVDSCSVSNAIETAIRERAGRVLGMHS